MQARPGYTPPPPSSGWSGSLSGDTAFQPIQDLPAPAKGRSVAAIVGVAFLAAALFAGGFLGWEFLTRSEVELPQSIGGMQRLDLPEFEAAMDRLEGELNEQGFKGDAAIYGTGTIPSFMAAVVDGRDAASDDAIFEELSAGFQQGAGGQASLGNPTVTQDGDATVRCSAVVGGGTQAAVCMWADPRSLGFVFTFFADANAARELTKTVRLAVQG